MIYNRRISQFSEKQIIMTYQPAVWILSPYNKRLPGRRGAIDGNEKLVTIDYSRIAPKWYHQSHSIFRWGAWVDPRFVMTKFAWRGSGQIPDFHSFGHETFVSHAARELIESFEPEVHQFLPVDIIGPRRRILEKQFLLVPGQAIRCFAVGISYGYQAIGQDPNDRIWHQQGSCRDCRPIFEDEAVEHKHLWIPIDFWKQDFFVSDRLRIALVDSGLSGFKFYPVETRNNLKYKLPRVKRSDFFQKNENISGSELIV